MSVDKRIVAASAGVAVVVAGLLATPAMFPQAFANEPQSHLLDTSKDLFPPTRAFDPKSLRKYDVDLNDKIVSTEVTHRDVVSKIAFGHRTMVSIITTPSGTYSSDALVSPYVRYPGIDVTPKAAEFDYGDYGTPEIRSGISTTPRGTWKWSSVTTGSFTYYSSNFTPARR